MNILKRISKIFESAEEISFDDSSKFVLMSDCHRGDGSWSDNFLKNQNIYFAALNYYYKEDYTYIELGDGDELWENSKISEIIKVHSDAFKFLSKFFKENRLHFIYGNHDMVKKNEKYVKNNLYKCFKEREKKYISLFEGVKVHEGLILKYKVTGDKILLIHGHQGDLINDEFWKLGRFLVRYLWKPLENIGVNDPTSTARNYDKKEDAEKRLTRWIMKEKHMLIAGHTHRPRFPKVGEKLYFNDGSCVHPRCITAIEIINGNITLVKWQVKTRRDNTLFIGREVLVGPNKLIDYFNTNKI
ncbi:metallophosphoesterase family protein [Clostridium sp.]|uniref:metallophosphoesterase family protein n=1 Tax=Clostridium sp. TaxID=1506 RepID=UPI003216D1EC